MEINPKGVSCRRNGTGISKSSFQRIVTRDHRWHPYKKTRRYQLNPDDNRRRIGFSNWFIERCRDHRFLATLIIGDEASFRMNGEVNTQNVRDYAQGEMPPIFIMTETTVAQKSLSGLDYAGMEHLQAHS